MKQTQIQIGSNTIKLNDVFYRSWGYEQTNINFVKVVGFTASGKSAKVVPIGQTIVKQHEFMAEDVAPDVNNVKEDSKPKAFLIDQSGVDSKPILKGNGDYYFVYEHPLYQSHYA